jgi:quercetin dioxygenase-like cupin family protein
VKKIINKSYLKSFEDDRGLLIWANTDIVGFDYKYLTIGTMKKDTIRGNHYHKRIYEKLLCIAGNLRFKLDDEYTLLYPGDVVEIPIGSVHTVYNDSDELAVFIEFKSEDFNENDKDIWVK